MKILLYIIGSISLLLTSCTNDRDIQEDVIPVDPNNQLIYYWNFNSLSGVIDEVSPDFSLITSDAKISYPGDGDGYMDSFNPGYTINARNSEIDGNGLRVRNPSNTRSLVFDLPTTGYKKIILQYATARTSSGATLQNFSYSVNGITYTTVSLPDVSFSPNPDPASDLVTLDFSTIPGVDNNPNFKIKIDFGGDGAAGTSGNNRFDNVTLEGIPN